MPSHGQDDATEESSCGLQNDTSTVRTPTKPADDSTVGSATKMVEGVVHGVKAAVDGALAWAEKKADKLGSKGDDTGPYSQMATSAPSDMDVIASGVLPAMPSDSTPEQSEKTAESDVDECRSGNGLQAGEDQEER